jgi:NET1-associated nuclear protein 1 (U3 small nucleolar RNA-associated protein 17)
VLQLISNWKVQLAVRGLAKAHMGETPESDPVPVGLLCDPRSGALVTNGRPGHLQFYCMSTDTQLYNVCMCFTVLVLKGAELPQSSTCCEVPLVVLVNEQEIKDNDYE